MATSIQLAPEIERRLEALTPRTKYFRTNGYTARIGAVATTISANRDQPLQVHARLQRFHLLRSGGGPRPRRSWRWYSACRRGLFTP